MLNLLHLINRIKITKVLSQKFNLFFKLHYNNIFFNSLVTIYNNLLINKIKTVDVFSNNASIFLLVTGFLFLFLTIEYAFFLSILI